LNEYDVDTKEDEEEATSQVTNLEEGPAAEAVSDGEGSLNRGDGNKRKLDEIKEEEVPPTSPSDDFAEKESSDPSSKKARVVEI
jgi:hypothetical protein